MDITWGNVLELLGTVTGEKVTVATLTEVDLPRSRRVSKSKKSLVAARPSSPWGWVPHMPMAGGHWDGHFRIIIFLKR